MLNNLHVRDNFFLFLLNDLDPAVTYLTSTHRLLLFENQLVIARNMLKYIQNKCILFKVHVYF